MSSFRTEVFPETPGFHIDLHSSVFFIGSCFANSIGNHVEKYGLHAMVNPFGVLYNPLSILHAFENLFHKTEYTENELKVHNDQWFSYDHYTAFSNSDKATCLSKINHSFKKAAGFVKNTNFIFITLGTSWAYYLKSSGKVVANCHKIPAREFDRVFISHHAIIKRFEASIEFLTENISNVKIILTVSPIRHWKEGAHGNTVSKSNLMLAVNQLERDFENVSYFPAYEIMMDDLRDYRFYATDMIHPNEQAISYIWKKFTDCYFTKETMACMHEMDKLISAVNHKAGQPNSQKHKDFLNKQLTFALALEKKYNMDLSMYKNILTGQL